MEEALYTILSGAAGITALTGTAIYPVQLPQGIGALRSALTFRRVGGFREHAMDGPTGLVESRFIIDCWGQTDSNGSDYANAKNLARAVRDVVIPSGGFKSTVGGIEIQGIFLNDEDETREDRVSGIGSVVRVSLDLQIWHKE